MVNYAITAVFEWTNQIYEVREYDKSSHERSTLDRLDKALCCHLRPASCALLLHTTPDFVFSVMNLWFIYVYIRTASFSSAFGR